METLPVRGRWPIIYVFFPLSPGYNPQFTRLFMTNIPQFFIMINFPWMKNKFTTIKLKPDVSTIVFENSEQTTETIVGPAETHSFTQLNDYRFFTMEIFVDEKKPKLFKLLFPNEIPLFEKIIVSFVEPPPLFETPLEIKMIATAPFFHVFKQKKVKLFSTFLKNVKKTFQFKHRIDSVTKLFHEFHEAFELFSGKENKLPPYRFYDHKINFKKKNPRYRFLYSMSQGKFQVLKKKSTKIQPVRPQQRHQFCLFVNQMEISLFV